MTHFVAAMGTSGTFMGTTRRLKRDLPEVKCYSAQPSSGFHGLEGLKHMPTAIVPGFYDENLADGNLWIETEDAYAMVRRLAREEGLLVGISSGCNVHAATLLARELAERGESAYHRDHALRQRRKIPQRTLLGRVNDPDRIRTLGGDGGARRARPIPTSAAAPCSGRSTATRRRSRVAMPLDNAFEGAQAARYELRPEDLLAADKAARERGWT